MTPVQASQLIEEYLSTNWTATKIAYENVEPRDWTETGTPLLTKGETPFIKIYKQFPTSEPITVSKSCRRYYGFLHVLVHVKESTGARVAETHATNLINLIEGKEILSGGEVFRFWDLVQETRFWTDGGWFVIDLSFKFSFEKFTSPS